MMRLASVMVVAAVGLLAAALVPAPIGVAQEGPRPVSYAAPMLTEVVDPFRPPGHIGASGNRGLEYGDTENEIVAAAADGHVLFAGPVAGRRAITISHADGIRTTYTGLFEIWVSEGQTVSRHSAIAVAAPGFHFGARIENHYLDPQILIDASQVQPQPRLLPPPDS